MVIGAVLVAAPARAAIVTITFTGTYDNLTFMAVSNFAGWSTSGLTSIPFSYSLTYDTSLNDPNATRVTAGSVIGSNGWVASHDMYGYTLGGLLSVNKTLGNLTWGAADLMGQTPYAGAVGDFWFDADISQATPTRSWVFFLNSSSHFSNLGQGLLNTSGGVDYYLFSQEAKILKTGGMSQADVRTSSPMTITSSIPEPSAFAMLAIGLAGISLMRRKRRE